MHDEVKFIQDKLTDMLFLRKGIELSDLVDDAAHWELEKDTEYNKICDEYGEKMEKL